MSIRLTVTLDDDVAARVKEEATRKGIGFEEALNELVRLGASSSAANIPLRTLAIQPLSLKLRPGLSLENISGLLDLIEGEDRR